MIQEIEISKLRMHPKNVRKTYTNIDELSDSIKAKGILQNLTVVENPEEAGTYWVVIGNRRLTAARKAGLETAPCQIVEMDERDQASTMLLENMQRSDLTIIEQSQGIQMVLDLGETVDGLSEKTGLSKSTIRHRVNIAKLDQRVLREKEEDEGFQLTLKDLYELEKIPDIKIRSEILREARSSNEITMLAKSRAGELKRKDNLKKLKSLLKKAGIRKAPKNAYIEMYSGEWDIVKSFALDDKVSDNLGVENQDIKMLYWIEYFRELRIIKRVAKKKKKLTKYEIEQKYRKEKKKQLKDLQKEMTTQRLDFVKLAIEKNLLPENPDFNYINKKLFVMLLKAKCWASIDTAYKFLSEQETWSMSEEEREKWNDRFMKLPLHQQLLIYVERAVADNDVSEWNTVYHKGNGEMLMEFEEFLKEFGFSYSSPEYEKISDGTHELYYRKDGEI